MIKVRQVKVRVDKKSDESIKFELLNKLKIKKEELLDYSIVKESIDARDKDNVCYSYEINVSLKSEDNYLKRNHNKDIEKAIIEDYEIKITGDKLLTKRPVIVGMGPCGLFAGYLLSMNGFKPIIIDRGESIEERVKTVESFWKEGKLNPNSNVSFGEGGAGTFSDGKLNTLVKDLRIKKIYEIFVENGAPKEILYMNKPHIGTDLLRSVIINMRNKMIDKGATFKYNSLLTDFIIENNKIAKLKINNNEYIDTDLLILAIGHSSRETFRLLHNKGFIMESKPFAVGLRVMHSQDMINKSQYGEYAKFLPNASYKLTYNTKEGRGVYSFCMCPGGFVVNSSSDNNKLCINGMSNHSRDSKIANSAIVVTVNEKDYGENLFDGVSFQEKLEEKAYNACNGSIPVQLYKDFKEGKESTAFESISPEFKGNIKFYDLNNIIPDSISSSIKEGMEYFGNKIDGFNKDDTVLAAVESRTSSPIRIVRDEYLESNIKGIYPGGEGAGYAGGITTSALDGIKIVERIFKIYKELK